MTFLYPFVSFLFGGHRSSNKVTRHDKYQGGYNIMINECQKYDKCRMLALTCRNYKLLQKKED